MSAKGAGDENFPVASRLLPAKSRPHVMAFYAFARGADDIADDPSLGSDEKLDILRGMSEQLTHGLPTPSAAVYKLHQSLCDTGVTHTHAQDLLQAFMRDAQKPRTDDWADLMAYCALSAAPVGRYLIELEDGQAENGFAANDALCAALQILNHIQDVKDDYLSLKRIYVPADWMVKYDVRDADLAAGESSPGLRKVLDLMLNRVDDLLTTAQALPKDIRSKALAREAGGIIAIAKALSKQLRARDPVAERIELSKVQAACHFIWGAIRA
ncbi:MAG: squalene/phytoene synthase family protein [Magnetovibrio sp.]|nr:squalene/phytoene synthase family protein [Magnetovibrio sp.]